MKWLKRILTILLFINITFAQASYAEDFSPNSFAYGLPLTLEANSTFYKIVLPVTVYQHLAQSNGEDIRIFDSAGKLMPFTLRNIAPQNQSAKLINLPVFPIYGKKNTDINNIPLRIQYNENGTSVEIRSDNTPKNQRQIIAYLLDTSRIQQPLYKFMLQTTPSAIDSIQYVNVAYSDTLDQFTPLVSNAAIASLHINGKYPQDLKGEQGDKDQIPGLYTNIQKRRQISQSIQPASSKVMGMGIDQRTIMVNNLQANYWLFTWKDTGLPLPLRAVTVQPSSTITPPSRIGLQLTPSDKSPLNEYWFNVPGQIPADGARVIFQSKNQVTQIKLFSRANAKDEWRYQIQGLTYDLQANGKENSSNELRFPATTDHYWRLVIENSQGGNTTPPVLELRWTPQELVFVANGTPPYMLTYGNSMTGAGNFDVNELMVQLTRNTGSVPVIKRAFPGNMQTLGGESRLKPPTAWQKWILWSVLVMGVVLLIWMALRLFKQIGREKI